MTSSTRPVKNQIGFHEKTNILDHVSGNVYLDLELSTVHIVRPSANTSLYVKTINITTQIPDNSFVQLFVIVNPIIAGVTLSFDPAITWNYLSTPTATLVMGNDLTFHLFSYDSGTTWKGIFSGSFGK